MIAGVGTDIVEIDRIRDAVGRWGDHFLKRIFSNEEISYCFSKRDPFPNLAARFAAKESTIKALTGLIGAEQIHVGDVAVKNEESGRPVIILSERISSAVNGSIVLHLTLSHERGYAVATVIAERE